MEKAPLIVFVYNRVEHARESLMALNDNYLASETELFVFSDSGLDPANNSKVDEVRSFLYTFKNKSNFKNVTIYEAESHKGLAESVIFGVSKVLDLYGRVIVVEDDAVVTRDFLNYMNECLDYFEGNPLIWSITGVGYNLKPLKNYNHYLYLIGRMGSDCWAIWKDRWEKIDWGLKNFYKLKSSLIERHKFNKYGPDMYDMLKAQMEQRIDSWAIRADYAQYQSGMLTVHPRKSFMRTIGRDGSGTNCNRIDRFKWKIKEEEFDYVIEDACVNRKICRAYRSQYSKVKGSIYKIWSILIKLRGNRYGN